MLPPTHTPVIFSNTGFHDLLDNPYNDTNDMLKLDLKLVTGDRHKEESEKYTLPKNKVVVTGQVSWQDYDKGVDKRASLIKLLIPSTYDRYILYDAGSIIRGYLSTQEQILTLTALLEYAEDHSEVALIVKPHPSHRPDILEALIKDYHFGNAYLVKDVPIFDCINVADVLITKWSTVGIEAMYKDVPVISVCLDKEKRFAIYGNAAEYVYDINDLAPLLDNPVKNTLRVWVETFLKDNFYRPTDTTPSRLCANEIIKSIKEKQQCCTS